MKRAGPPERRTPLRRSDPATIRAWQARSTRKAANNRRRSPAAQQAYDDAGRVVAARSGGACELGVSRHCTGRYEERHHIRRQADARKAGEPVDDSPNNLMASCGPCNLWVEQHPARARALGFLR